MACGLKQFVNDQAIAFSYDWSDSSPSITHAVSQGRVLTTTLKGKPMKNTIRLLALGLIVALLGACASPPPPPPAHHPAYLRALSDLRAARWLIEHRPGDWPQSMDEVEAVRQIDAAIHDIRDAAADDGKNLDYHPAVDERPDHRGRLHEAIDYLRKARADVEQEEDNPSVRGLRNRSIGHMDAAISSVRRVFSE
jgi:hypothetical protein